MPGVLLFAAFAFASAAPASADTLDVLYKNTLTLADMQGGVTTVLIREDGKFEQTNARGAWAAGFWTQKDGRFCMTARGESQICFPLDGGKSVGDMWEITGPAGKVAWTANIQEGRADLGLGAPASGTP